MCNHRMLMSGKGAVFNHFGLDFVYSFLVLFSVKTCFREVEIL